MLSDRESLKEVPLTGKRQVIDSPWMNARQAANYCGYSGPKYFKKLADEYEIPRYGPSRNRYHRNDLDTWLRSFAERGKSSAYFRRSKAKPFTPLHNVIFTAFR